MKPRNQRNKLRFFYPSEWHRFIGVVANQKHQFIFKMLVGTGMRIGELQELRVRNINLDRKYLTVIRSKTKKQRNVKFSTMLKSMVRQRITQNRLKGDDRLIDTISVQFLDRVLKKYARMAELDNPEDICLSTFRKTTENYLCALGVNTMVISKAMGHTVNVAEAYYVSEFLDDGEKGQIRSVIGDVYDNGVK